MAGERRKAGRARMGLARPADDRTLARGPLRGASRQHQKDPEALKRPGSDGLQLELGPR